MADLRDILAAALKRNHPSKLMVFTSDDDEGRNVAVPNVRNRWVRVLAAVGDMPWTRVEMLDKAGALLGQVINPEAETSVELATTRPAAAAELGVGVREMMAIMLKGQEQALRFRDAETQALLKSTTEVMRVMVEAVKNLASIHRDQMDAAVDAAESRAAAEGGSDIKQLLEAAPTILQALPAIRTMLNGSSSRS